MLLGSAELLYRTPAKLLLRHLYLNIQHRGRKSGNVYETLVTLLHLDRATGEIYVTSSMQGRKSDWYQNLCAAPPISIQVGYRRYEVAQRFLDAPERENLYRRVWRTKPLRARIGLFVTGHRWPNRDEDFVTLAEEMPAICFTPRSETE